MQRPVYLRSLTCEYIHHIFINDSCLIVKNIGPSLACAMAAVLQRTIPIMSATTGTNATGAPPNRDISYGQR